MSKVSVIIPAAGAGKRFGGDVKKPFAQLDGRPVFIRTIELFLSRPDVAEIFLAVSPDDYEVVREKYAANVMLMGFKLVKGGHERYESVRLTLEQVDAGSDLVCVHDAVRPCLLETWIDSAFSEAEKAGAAILAAPLTGTIKKVAASKIIDETISREGLYEAQTPQVFRRDWIVDAYAKLPAGAQPTDDSQVLEMAGYSVAVVEADRRNLKITSPGDMSLASVLLRDMAKRPKAGPMGAFEEAKW